MKGGTLFSGIGAPEVAAPWIDWRWHAEIESFPAAVHAHHHRSLNLGDVTRIEADAVESVDIIVFGSPCQSFSVAGKRLGLDDPRGNLALVALRLVCRNFQRRPPMTDDLPGYDSWRTRLPPEPWCDDPDCTCTTGRRDKWCPVHGKDPDDAYEEKREREWDR